MPSPCHSCSHWVPVWGSRCRPPCSEPAWWCSEHLPQPFKSPAELAHLPGHRQCELCRTDAGQILKLSQNSASPGQVSSSHMPLSPWKAGGGGRSSGDSRRGERKRMFYFSVKSWWPRHLWEGVVFIESGRARPSPPSSVVTAGLSLISGPCLVSSRLTSPLPCFVVTLWMWCPVGSGPLQVHRRLTRPPWPLAGAEMGVLGRSPRQLCLSLPAV